MSFTKTDEYVAENKLQRTSFQGFVSNFFTIWKGVPLLATFSEVENCVINIFYPRNLDNDEIIFIEDLMIGYVTKEEQWKRTEQ